MSGTAVHAIAGGACIVCGELEAWLIDRGHATKPAAQDAQR